MRRDAFTSRLGRRFHRQRSPRAVLISITPALGLVERLNTGQGDQLLESGRVIKWDQGFNPNVYMMAVTLSGYKTMQFSQDTNYLSSSELFTQANILEIIRFDVKHSILVFDREMHYLFFWVIFKSARYTCYSDIIKARGSHIVKQSLVVIVIEELVQVGFDPELAASPDIFRRGYTFIRLNLFQEAYQVPNLMMFYIGFGEGLPPAGL